MIIQTKKYIAVLIIGILFGALIGFYIGSYTTIKAVAKIASGFIDIDEDLISAAIYQYKHHIGNCYLSKTENAFNNSNKRKQT